MEEKISFFIKLMKSEKYFEAHEYLENVWQLEKSTDRLYLQGLIQLAVALHHKKHNNILGYKVLLKRAQEKFKLFPKNYFGAECTSLINQFF